ncbi:hypothetical protein J6590_107513 [Homalodisca vitripennis]|nr:hypothetical protein J6590_107513 [Homalodisca vitripennis]
MLNSHILLFPARVHPESAEVIVGLPVCTADRGVQCRTFCRTATRRSAIRPGHTAGPIVAAWETETLRRECAAWKQLPPHNTK